MRHLIAFIPFLVISISYGQKNNLAKVPPQPPTKRELEIEARNHNCIKKVNKSLSDRLKNYPFSNSTQIQLVSFLGNTDTSENGFVFEENSLPRLNDTVCYSKLMEIKTLTFLQIDKLTDILYNYVFRGPIYTQSIANCYIPRNAILFLDSAGKVFEYIEICFQCQRIQESSEKITPFPMCEQKLDLLKDFFKMSGLEYGISKGLIGDDQ